MYCLYHNLLPTTLSSNFQRGFHIHNYFTRFSHQHRSHPARLKIKQLYINCLGPVLWNSLPEVIRKSQSMGSSSQLKIMLIRSHIINSLLKLRVVCFCFVFCILHGSLNLDVVSLVIRLIVFFLPFTAYMYMSNVYWVTHD